MYSSKSEAREDRIAVVADEKSDLSTYVGSEISSKYVFASPNTYSFSSTWKSTDSQIPGPASNTNNLPSPTGLTSNDDPRELSTLTSHLYTSSPQQHSIPSSPPVTSGSLSRRQLNHCCSLHHQAPPVNTESSTAYSFQHQQKVTCCVWSTQQVSHESTVEGDHQLHPQQTPKSALDCPNFHPPQRSCPSFPPPRFEEAKDGDSDIAPDTFHEDHACHLESRSLRFYPVFLCRDPSGIFEPIHFCPAYQHCQEHSHHHQQQQQQPLDDIQHHRCCPPPPLHHHHHHNHLHCSPPYQPIDNSCPIHGREARSQLGDYDPAVVQALESSSSSSQPSSLISVVASSQSSSSFPAQASSSHHSHSHASQQPRDGLDDYQRVEEEEEEEEMKKSDASLMVETQEKWKRSEMNDDSFADDRVAVERADNLVAASTSALTCDSLVQKNGDDDDVDGDDDDDDDDAEKHSEQAYPTSHTPPERDACGADPRRSRPGRESRTEEAKGQKEFGGMAFTIDFGNDKDQPEITDNWKKLVPYKVHAGIQERQELQKKRRQSKELAAEIKRSEQMKKSRSHSGYMSEGCDASSVVSTDVEDASICSDFIFRHGPKYSSPKRNLVKDKRPSSSKFETARGQVVSGRKVTGSAGRTGTGVRQNAPGKTTPVSSANRGSMKATGSLDPKFSQNKKVDRNQQKKIFDDSLRTEKSSRTANAKKRVSATSESSFDADVEGTAYLIKKMLNDIPSTSSSSSIKALGSPGIARRLKMGMKQAREVDDEDEDRPRPPSESGTYTIDDDDDDDDVGGDAGEVVKARKKIDEAFGVTYKLPVIDASADDNDVRTPARRSSGRRKPVEAEMKKTSNKKKEGFAGSAKKLQDATTAPAASRLSPSAVINKNGDEDEEEEEEEDESLPNTSMEREDSFERLMNETSSRLNALIDATSRVIGDARFAVKAEPQTSTFTRPRKSTTASSTIREEAEKSISPNNSGFFVVSCDTPATRKMRSTSSSCEAGSLGTRSPPPPSNLHLSTHSVSRVEESASSPLVSKRLTASLLTKRGKSAEVKNNKGEAVKHRDVFNVTPVSTGNVDRKTARNFVPPFAKSLSNVSHAFPSKEGTTFIRDVALIRDMVENTSGGSARLGPDRVRSALGRQASANSSSSSIVQTGLRTNRTFALRCSKVAPTGAAEVPGGLSARHPTRSRSVGNDEGARLKSRESSKTRLDSQRRQHPSVSPASDILSTSGRPRRGSGAVHDRDPDAKTSAFSRKDGGRYSMRVEPKRNDPTNPPPSNAWQRRKNYDPRKSAELSRSRSSSTRRIDVETDRRSHKDSGRLPSKANQGKKLDKIAQMSHAVADNLNALAKSSDLERPAPLRQLPVFTHDSPSSAFSNSIVTKRRTNRSVGGGDNSPEDASPYDSILVDSIQQVSKKVKSLANVLIGKMRDDCDFEDQPPKIRSSPTITSSPSTIWQNANPDLTCILENLKRTEIHLQEVHKTLFSNPSEPTASNAGPLPNSPHLARKAGFIPIDRACSGAEFEEEEEGDLCDSTPTITPPSTRRSSAAEKGKQIPKTCEYSKTSTSTSAASANRKKTTPCKATNHNPLSGDEYY